MVPKRAIKKTNIVKSNNYNNLSLSDVSCPICRSILIEPVTLPCNHGFCSACFDSTMANTNLVCPLCRVRVGSWLRASKKENKLINSNLWSVIQKHFPQQVKNKLEGVDEVVEEVPIRITSEPGEIRREYEAQRVKEEEEFRKRQEEETRASELLIRKLQQEEELEKSIIEGKLKRDKQVAKKLAEQLCFDPGPSTSKVELEKSSQKRGPLDTFLRNMANKQLSVSLKPISDEKCDNYRKKEFTTKVLFQDRSASLLKNNESITLWKLNKVASQRQSLDSNDAITSECIYFKPIEQKKIPPCKTTEILRVPAVTASSSSSTLRAPSGHVAFNHSVLLSPFVGLYNSPTLQAISPSYKTGFVSRKRSSSSCEKEESQVNIDNTPKGKMPRIQLNSRQTRSMTKIDSGSVHVKLYKKPEKRKSLLKNIKTSPKKAENKCHELFEEELNRNNKNRLNCEFDRSFSSPFLGFEKNYKFSLKGRNGVKNLNTIFDNFNSNNNSFKGDNIKSKSPLDDKFSSHSNREYKKENAEKPDSRSNGISLNNIEFVIGAKCLRSVSSKRKLQEEEDLKLARKLHEELNCVKYPTRNSISHISKKFPTPRRQITLYKFLEK